MGWVSAETRGGKQIQEGKPVVVEYCVSHLGGAIHSSLLLPKFYIALDPGVSACTYRVIKLVSDERRRSINDSNPHTSSCETTAYVCPVYCFPCVAMLLISRT